MKHKQLTLSFCLVAVILAAFNPRLNAFTYSDGDLLLVFRKTSFNDIEFNLGTVSNYLGLANGTVKGVTNFNATLLSSNFNNNLNGVTVSLVACTTPPGNTTSRAWLTDPDPTATRQDVTGSRFGSIWSKVNNVGVQAQTVSGSITSQVYIVSSGDASSYSYIASSAGGSDASTLSGATLFGIDGQVALTLRFWELHVSNVTPKPDSLLVGSFAIVASTSGTVTFTAGSGGGGCTPPSISGNPGSATVFAGGPASFAVTATGASSYQWQFNSTDIPGATASSYNFTAHGTNAGNYRVLVSNGSCASTSTVATLTVNLPSAASFGTLAKAPGGPFSLKLSGTSGAYYEIQANTNLTFTNAWTTIAFITNSGGATTFSDPAATNAQKFYRALAR